MPSSPISWLLFLPKSLGSSPLPTPVSCQVMKKVQKGWRIASQGQAELSSLCNKGNPRPFLEPIEFMRWENASPSQCYQEISVSKGPHFSVEGPGELSHLPLWAHQKGPSSFRQALHAAAPHAATETVAPLGSELKCSVKV